MNKPVPVMHWALLAFLLLLGGCSMGQMVARSSVSIMDGSVDALNRESDLQLARDAIPANIKLIEGLIFEDPGNVDLRVYAAQGFYGYSFGFVELENPQRASALYRRGFEQGREALRLLGVTLPFDTSSPDEIKAAVRRLGTKAVPALFWTASNWAKQIDLQRTDPSRIAQLAGTAALMERVAELDENYYYGGPKLFFAVYYGSRSPMFGGDYARASDYFQQANEMNQHRFLMVDVLYAEYLARQQLDQQAFHQRLQRVVEAPSGLLPEMELVNEIARHRAGYLLQREQEWF